MSKYGKDIKIGDLLWAINDSQKPSLIAMIVTDIIVDEFPLTTYLKIQLQLPDGSCKFISLLENKDKTKRDYNIPLLQRLNNTTSYYNKDNEKVYICFDKLNLYNAYIKILEQDIFKLEQVIINSQKNLVLLNERLSYIQKQHEIAE